LHPKQNIESEKKWQIVRFSGAKNGCMLVKGLNHARMKYKLIYNHLNVEAFVAHDV